MKAFRRYSAKTVFGKFLQPRNPGFGFIHDCVTVIRWDAGSSNIDFLNIPDCK
jgi:hypothetical protein